MTIVQIIQHRFFAMESGVPAFRATAPLFFAVVGRYFRPQSPLAR